MTKQELYNIEQRLIQLRATFAEKDRIINDYESKLNDPDYLKQRLDELGKVIQTEEGDGSAFNPYKYWNPGVEVHQGEWWYTHDGYLWEAKADGVPTDSLDSNYWNIIV